MSSAIIQRRSIIAGYVFVFWIVLPAMLWIFGRALDEALALPAASLAARIAGGVLFSAASIALVRSILRLSIDGRGLPISHLPPERLVAQGAYARCRHPIYVAYNVAFAAGALLVGSYGAAFGGGLLLTGLWIAYALWFEEPRLIARYGEAYRAYAASTPLFPVPAFAVDKLYVDLVTEDGTVAIGYALEVRAAAFTFAPAGFELYEREGERVKRTVTRGTRSSGETLSLQTGGREVRFEHRTVLGGWAPPISGSISWAIVRALGEATLSLPDGRVMRGRGYSDRVVLRGSPRRLGLARLEWGRVHFRDSAVIYTELELEDGTRWAPAIVWRIGGEPVSIEGWSIEGSRVIRLPRGERIELVPEHELHAGEAIDRARFPRWIEHVLSRLLMGPSAEKRWLSRARSVEHGEGWAIHESVRFGAEARR